MRRRFQGLRARSFLLGAVVWLAMVALVVLVSSQMLDTAFEAIEEREFAETRARMAAVMDVRREQLEWKARDWAEWDAAAEWLRTGEGPFAAENLNDSALPVLGEGFLSFWTRDGRLAGALASDLASRSPRSPDTSCMRRILSDSAAETSFGIHRCGDGLHLSTLRPVRNSLDGTTPAGWLILGHPIDGIETAALSGIFGRPLRLVRDSTLPHPRAGDSVARLRIPVPVRGEAEPNTWLEAEVPRPVRTVYARLRGPLGWGLAVIALGGALLFLWILERFVVRRIVRLSDGVVEFDHAGEVPRRPFWDGGSDEIGALGQAMDTLVARLLGAQANLAGALDAAQDAARAKSAFLASVTHDLRTPLNGMIGLADYVQRTPLDEGQREAVDLLRSAAENLLTMINDVLEFSRQEAGRSDLQPEDVSTEEVFHASLRVLAPIAHHQGIDLEVELDPDLPTLVRLDAARMRQILHNLVGNALKFTPRGEVSLSVRVAGRIEDGIRLRVEVRDTGPGIPPELVDAVFEPFVQAGSGVSRQAGTGLGLPIAKRLTAQMGGELRLETEVGKGSLFHFEIDADVPAQASRLVPLRISASGRARVALWVQGARLRRNLVEILEGLDLHPVVIGGPDDLDDWAGGQDGARLVVVDTECLGSGDLPGLARMRERPGTRTVPVIVLSRTDRLGDDAICREHSVQSVLRRPVAPSTLLQAIDKELHPRLDVLVLASNPFLRTLVSGILLARGHCVRFEEPAPAEGTGGGPDVCILDGEAPGFAARWAETIQNHPAALRIQVGGSRATATALRLERSFSAEELNELVERGATVRTRRSEG